MTAPARLRRIPNTGPTIEARRDIGAAVRAARGEAGLTQAEVGALAGVSHAMISLIESGDRLLPLARMPVLARAVGLPADALDRPLPIPRDAEEAEWLLAFRHLDPADREALLELARS